MKCSVCHRTLKSKESIKRGAGRVCFKKIQRQEINPSAPLSPEWQEITQFAQQADSPIDWYTSLEIEQMKRVQGRIKEIEGSSFQQKLHTLFDLLEGGTQPLEYASVSTRNIEDVEVGEACILPSDIRFIYQEQRQATASAVGHQIIYSKEVQNMVDNQTDYKLVRHICLHELGHLLSNAFPPLERHIIENPQGAFGKVNLKQRRFEGTFGQFSPEESFAECFATYIHSPVELKERHPSAYHFVDVMITKKIGLERVRSYLSVVDLQLNKWYS